MQIKNDNEGRTINKVELDRLIIFCISFVSQYNHINAKKVVRGINTIKPARRDDFLAISPTVTTTIAVIVIFNMKYNIFYL